MSEFNSTPSRLSLAPSNITLFLEGLSCLNLIAYSTSSYILELLSILKSLTVILPPFLFTKPSANTIGYPDSMYSLSLSSFSSVISLPGNLKLISPVYVLFS